MILLRYRLFFIGEILFYQVLDQDKRLTSTAGYELKRDTTRVGDAYYDIVSASNPAMIVNPIDHGRVTRSTIYLRGCDSKDDLSPSYRVVSGNKDDILSYISYAIFNYVKRHYELDIRTERNETEVTIWKL